MSNLIFFFFLTIFILLFIAMASTIDFHKPLSPAQTLCLSCQLLPSPSGCNASQRSHS